MSNLVLADALSGSERERLDALEDAIRHGLQSFIEAGQALTEVRDSRLYREGFVTFEEYCDQRWSLSKTHGNRLIQAAEVVAILPAGSDDGVTPIGVTPSNEAQARELAPLLNEPEKLRETWQRAVDATEGRPTAAAVREAREQVAPRPVAPSRPSTSAPWQAPSPATPIHSEPSMFDDAGIVEAEIVVDPPASSTLPAPQGVGPISPATREALKSFIDSDANIHLAAWRTSFMAAIGRTTSITEFTPDAVAVKADQQLIDELEAAHRHLGNYIDRINAQRPSGLRLVQKG